LVDSVVSAETETEVESTSAILNEVQSHSQNLQKELAWPARSLFDLQRAVGAITGTWWLDIIRLPKCDPHLICVLVLQTTMEGDATTGP
jgi:hypothetical protein